MSTVQTKLSVKDVKRSSNYGMWNLRVNNQSSAWLSFEEQGIVIEYKLHTIKTMKIFITTK